MANAIKQENESVANALSKTERFFEENGKILAITITALIALICGIYAGYKFAYQPKQEEARAQMFRTEAVFAQEDWETALNGDGNIMGFKQIIDEYGAKPGKAVYLYAAICEMQREGGDLDAAMGYLQKYSGDEIMQARADALKGDIHCSRAEYGKALSLYKKAAGISDNVFNASYLFKAAQCHEALSEKEEALKIYKNIKDLYPQSVEARDIEKYITRLEISE